MVGESLRCGRMQIMRGVHENMLDLPYMDQDMERTAEMTDWLCDFDLWQRQCMRNMRFELMPLLPVSVLACASLCQGADCRLARSRAVCGSGRTSARPCMHTVSC